MPNLLFNQLGCRYLEHKKKHAPKGEGRGGGGGSDIYLKKIGGGGLRKNYSPWGGRQGDFLDIA